MDAIDPFADITGEDDDDDFGEVETGAPVWLDPSEVAWIDTPPRKRRRRPTMRAPQRGNTTRAQAQDARRSTLEAATGRAPLKNADEWRELLRSGERTKARTKLSGRGMTHNAGSGFGLA